MNQDANFVEHLDELTFLKLEEGVSKLGAFTSENSLQHVLVFQEGHLGVLTVDVREDWILHLPLLNVDCRIRKHQVKSILVSLVRLIIGLLGFKVPNFEER